MMRSDHYNGRNVGVNADSMDGILCCTRVGCRRVHRGNYCCCCRCHHSIFVVGFGSGSGGGSRSSCAANSHVILIIFVIIVNGRNGRRRRWRRRLDQLRLLHQLFEHLVHHVLDFLRRSRRHGLRRTTAAFHVVGVVGDRGGSVDVFGGIGRGSSRTGAATATTIAANYIIRSISSPRTKHLIRRSIIVQLNPTMISLPFLQHLHHIFSTTTTTASSIAMTTRLARSIIPPPYRILHNLLFLIHAKHHYSHTTGYELRLILQRHVGIQKVGYGSVP
mmetsp:Transcript_2324/g.5020  ORF Transcript_2324/g.5020 Transcript_2324/m.5020 type:complete len:276 (+) Transcript_2324:1174-2001(+)